jgi:hypothetical protein
LAAKLPFPLLLSWHTSLVTLYYNGTITVKGVDVRKKAFVTVIVFLIIASFALAQSNTPSNCPSSTIQQATASDSTLRVVRDFLLDPRIDTVLDNPESNIENIETVQQAFWGEAFPLLSQCTQLLEASILIGRGLDEMLIIMSLTLADRDTTVHQDALDEIVRDLATLDLFGETEQEAARPTELPDTETYYVTSSTANVRGCADSNCERLTTLSYGDDIEVIERVDGDSVAGSTRWYRVLLSDGREGFIHSSLVSTTRPVAGSSGNSGSSTGSTGSSNNASSSNNVQPTEVPQQQEQPTQPPPPPAPVGYSCDCNKTCGAMTCEEAYFQLNTCGCGARDNDNDGVPCESVCSGG